MALPDGTLITVYEPNSVGYYDLTTVDVVDLASAPSGSFIYAYASNGVGGFNYQQVLVNDIGDLPAGSLAEVREPNGVGWFDPTLVDSTELAEGGYVGPLDIVPGAVVAFSQRRLAADFVGNVIKIDNGTATQNFTANLDNAVDTAVITAFIGAGTPGVATLYDQSGNMTDLDNASPEPHWTAGSPPAVGNVNSAQLYTTNEVTFANSEATVFLVCKQSGANSPLGAEMDFNTGNYVRFQAPTTGGASALQDIYNDDTGNDSFAVYDIVASGDYQLWDGAWSIAGHSMYLNGAAQTPTSVFDTENPPGSITDRMIMFCGDEGEYLAEIIMYDTILTAPNRLAIRQNIAAYYGITLS